MRYHSTRGFDCDLSFKETVLTGLARDGGLVLPSEIPDARSRLGAWSRLSYGELALEIISLYADDLPKSALQSIIGKSYSAFRSPEVTPVVTAGKTSILELFHGPTFAFKDLALQFLGNLFEYLLGETGSKLNIVAATSGDTGSAAIYGVRGRKNLGIFVLHPDGRVSPMQRLQMTSVLDGNVHNLAIGGTFDDCQNIVKELFGNLEFRDRYSLGAVNSINWARVLAQVVYYFYGAFRLMERTGKPSVSFTVPTGNFGDVFAGYVAARMGLPVDRLVIAVNDNDILDRCFRHGVYKRGSVAATYSPSMDIQIASNFERWLYYFYGESPQRVKEAMDGFKAKGEIRLADGAVSDPWLVSGKCTAENTLKTIGDLYRETGYLADPHTAVGIAVSREFAREESPMLCLSTAHPAKFGDAILKATGSDLAHHPVLDALSGLETRCDRLPAKTDEVARYVAAAAL